MYSWIKFRGTAPYNLPSWGRSLHNFRTFLILLHVFTQNFFMNSCESERFSITQFPQSFFSLHHNPREVFSQSFSYFSLPVCDFPSEREKIVNRAKISPWIGKLVKIKEFLISIRGSCINFVRRKSEIANGSSFLYKSIPQELPPRNPWIKYTKIMYYINHKMQPACIQKTSAVVLPLKTSSCKWQKEPLALEWWYKSERQGL